MNNLIDPFFLLNSFKMITVELQFLYEKNVDGYTIDHTTVDLFGENTHSFKLPLNSHYLEPQVMRVKYGSEQFNKSLEPSILKHLLKKVKEKITDVCFNKARFDLLNGYLKKLNLLSDEVIKYQHTRVITINHHELEIAGYSPEFICSKENAYVKEFQNEIKRALTEPLNEWLLALIESINKSKSLKGAKEVLREFTGYNPTNFKLINTKVTPSYELNKDLTTKQLSFLFEKLIDSGYIDKGTTEKQFYDAFSGEAIREKIEWTARIGELVWFKNALGSKDIVTSIGSINQTTALVFKMGNNDLSSQLKGGKENKPKTNRKSVDEALTLLRNYLKRSKTL